MGLLLPGTICRRVMICVILCMHGVYSLRILPMLSTGLLARPQAGLSFRLVAVERMVRVDRQSTCITSFVCNAFAFLPID